MTPRHEGWTVVCAGHWNRMIFTPEWVSEHLFHVAEFERLVPFMPEPSVLYQLALVSLHVAENRIVLSARRCTAAALAESERIAVEALRELPNTPVSAVGVNFSFVDEAPAPDLLGLFTAADNAELVGNNWVIQSQGLSRRIISENLTLNVKLTLNGNIVQLD